MANARAYQAAMNAGGGFIRWDWNKNKYVWVSKEDLQKQASNKKATAPSPYEQNIAALKNRHRSSNQPKFKVPVKKAYRQPLMMSNKQVRPSPTKARKTSPVKNPKAAVHHVGWQDLIKMRERDDKENLPAVGGGEKKDVAGPPAELVAGHGTFVSVISNRLIHLNAALTFWRQNPGDLISYLKRSKNDSVIVDVLPVLTLSLVHQTPKVKMISMGAWLEFLPTLHRLLSSKFADYIKASLDLIRTLLRCWSKELEKHKSAQNAAHLLQSQSVSGIYRGMIAMSETVSSLAERKGSIGKKAKVVMELLDNL